MSRGGARFRSSGRGKACYRGEMRLSLFSKTGFDLGIDLGTANTLVALPTGGVVFDQPSVCCFQGYDAVPRFISAGSQAHSHIGKVAKPLKIVFPLRNGVLSDMLAATELLTFVRKSISMRHQWRRPRPLIGVPADATQAERHALVTAALDAGFSDPELVAEPLLAAIGLGLDIDEPRAKMVVDCGAGTTDIAVISLGAICVSQTVRGGGDALDQALADHLNFRHRFQIGTVSAEGLKREISATLSRGESNAVIEVSGLDAASGLPRVLSVRTNDLMKVWDRFIDPIAEGVRAALGATAPELSNDILEDGILLCGGGALAGLLADRIAERTGVSTTVADAPLEAVARGLSMRIGAALP